MIDVATEGVSSQAAEAAGDTLGGATGVAEQLPAALLATAAEAFTNGLPAAAVITVGHLPPGTSKWNKIEHRMFSPITMNWRGPPLETHEIVVETIAATTTKTGLTIQATLDTNAYQRGIKITDKEMKAFAARHLQRHEFHGTWNYTVTGKPADDTTRPDEQK